MKTNNNKGNVFFKRGDIFYRSDVSDGKRTEGVQGGIRPCIIVQNNVGNTYAPTVIVADITTKNKKKGQPTHTPVKLKYDSTILCEQIHTISKKDLLMKIGHLNEEQMKPVDRCLLVSMGLM